LLLLENIYMCVFVCAEKQVKMWDPLLDWFKSEIGVRPLLQASLAQHNLPRCWMLWRKQSVNVVIGN
jgi:chaperone required for assembly of F1-ATPase